MATRPPSDHLRAALVPASLTPLVGREREVALALALLRRPDLRLLTLTGPGGIGKTRLALAVAAEVGADFADGVRFVSLAEVRDAGLVATAVARAAGLLDAGDASAQDRLVAALRQAETLLVLDNFEHVLAAAPLASALLAACPGIKILATSRTLLRVDGEHALPVPPLALPDEGTGDRGQGSGERRTPVLTPDPCPLSPGALAGVAAVQLFAQRGQAVNPSFAVTDANAPLVADICRRLDGVPLAIELAAARLTHLSPSALSERLERRLPLLTGGGRDRPLRLQTMRDAIAWSHDLLRPEQQTLFRRLAVFVGGCTLEAAEAVGRGTEGGGGRGEDDDGDRPSALRPPPSVLDLVAALVESSLLRPETGPGGTTRYRMLETIREFAGEQLEASGEGEAVRERHAAYVVAFAERNELAELLPDGERVLALLDAEHANVRVALAWLEERAEAGAYLRLAASLGYFWSEQGYYHEGRAWLERALAHGGDLAAADRAKVLVALGMTAIYQGADRDAESRLSEGLARCRELGDPLGAVTALIGLATLARLRGDYGRGTAFLEEALAVAWAVADQRLAGIMAGVVLINLCALSRAQGESAQATEQVEAGLRLLREGGYTEGLILALGDLGDLARDRGDHARALACYREALGLGQENPRTRVATDVIEAVGIVATSVGQAERGARLLGAAAAQRERLGLRLRERETQAALERAVAAARAALGEPAFAAAWAAGRGLGPAKAVATAIEPFPPPAETPGVPLTPRETEIIRLLAAGQSDAAIAAALFLSVRTVENHVAHIFAKLGVRSRAAAAVAAGDVAPAPPPPV